MKPLLFLLFFSVGIGSIFLFGWADSLPGTLWYRLPAGVSAIFIGVASFGAIWALQPGEGEGDSE